MKIDKIKTPLAPLVIVGVAGGGINTTEHNPLQRNTRDNKFVARKRKSKSTLVLGEGE